MASTDSHRAVYRRTIDGIRGIAIALVVGYHAQVPGFDGGFVGVDVFFVISGYLIVGRLRRELEATGRIAWAGFFSARARRLVPAAVVMTVVVIGVGQLVLDAVTEREILAKQAIAAVVSVSNLYFGHSTPAGLRALVEEANRLQVSVDIVQATPR